MNRAVVLSIGFLVGIAAATVGHQIVGAQQSPITRTILQQKDLEGVAEREVIMYRADIAPGALVGRHYHSGPELVYVLEGSLILEPEGHAPVTLKAGESTHMPAKHIHGGKNMSATAPVKVIVFMVGEKGQPLATPVQ